MYHFSQNITTNNVTFSTENLGVSFILLERATRTRA